MNQVSYAATKPEIDGTPLRKSATKSEHIRALDGMRGLAILLVFFHHCSSRLIVRPDDSFLLKLFAKSLTFGACGVDLFFVLSGFLITRLLLDSVCKPAYFKNFFARRALRIFPLYYGVLAICTVVGSVSLGTERPHSSLFGATAIRGWLWVYGTNIVQAFAPDFRNGWGFGKLDHFWSLAVEEHFYLVWPLLIMALRLRTLKIVCVLLILLSPLIRTLCCLEFHNGLAAYVLTPCRLDGLATGSLIALLLTDKSAAAFDKRAVKMFCAACVILPAFCAIAVRSENIEKIIGPSLYSLLFGSFLLLSLERKAIKHSLESGALALAGKYSYGVYVFHNIIIGLLAIYWHHSADHRLLDFCTFVLVAAAATAATSVLSYHCYEIHFLKLKHFFTTRDQTQNVERMGIAPPLAKIGRRLK